MAISLKESQCMTFAPLDAFLPPVGWKVVLMLESRETLDMWVLLSGGGAGIPEDFAELTAAADYCCNKLLSSVSQFLESLFLTPEPNLN